MLSPEKIRSFVETIFGLTTELFQLNLMRWSFQAWRSTGNSAMIETGAASGYIARRQACYLLRRIVLRWRSWATLCLYLRESRCEREEAQSLEKLTGEQARMDEGSGQRLPPI